MEKGIIDRRMEQMAAEGVDFKVNTHVGVDISGDELLANFDAIALTGGSEVPRDLPIAGRECDGVYFAMDFLRQQNKRNAGDTIPESEAILATGKHVIVIGGGDTGSDCIGTSNRQGAVSVTQLEIMPKPPEKENKAVTWPDWPTKMRTSSSQEEGCHRDWSVSAKRFIESEGKVTAIECVRVDWNQDSQGRWQMSEIEGSEFELKADLVLLAMGFVNPVQEGILEQLSLDKDIRGNVQAPTDGDKAYNTSVEKVFAAGDIRRGQSLVVWAIREGRQCAQSIDNYLSS